jgi:protocatechuate 3,4-dioxygenase beta subunit
MSRVIVSLLLAALAAGVQDSSTRLIGRVLDADTNQPLAGATIAFLPTSSTPRPPLLAGPLRTETDGRGVFTMDLAPGRYRIQTQRAGFISHPGVVITIDGGTVSVPDIRLSHGGAIEGRILDATGRPMTGVSVFAVRPTTGVMRSASSAIGVGRNAQTNDRGEFRLSGLPSGSYYVRAEPRPSSPFGPPSSTAVSLVNTYYPGKTDLSAASLIEVTAGNTTRAIEVQMQQAATVTVSGVAVDDAGRPVAGAHVSLSEEPSITLQSFTVISQREGIFRINVPNGTYRILATIPEVIRPGGGVIRSGSAGGTGASGIEVTVEGRPISDVKVVARRR